MLDQFGSIFNHVAQRMLGKAVTGSVRFSGKAIVPELEYHGPRDSAALKVVRWVIFDLASLTLGITNTAAHHPRFLLHDSPREADLAAAIYVSLFSAAHDLEKASGASPAFQYIVTTTEPPPDALNKRRGCSIRFWMRPARKGGYWELTCKMDSSEPKVGGRQEIRRRPPHKEIYHPRHRGIYFNKAAAFQQKEWRACINGVD